MMTATNKKSILISFILSINKQSWRALGEDICQQTPKERKKEKKQQEVDTRRTREHRETETQRHREMHTYQEVTS
jgi:uncharacterized protein YdaU (DUF1376 family)